MKFNGSSSREIFLNTRLVISLAFCLWVELTCDVIGGQLAESLWEEGGLKLGGKKGKNGF